MQPPVQVCESNFQALRMLNVENLVIPSVPELVPMWINKYGFTHIENNLMTELIKYNTLMFPSAVSYTSPWWHKPQLAQVFLYFHKFSSSNIVSSSVWHTSFNFFALLCTATKSDEANKNGTGLVRGKGYEKLAFFDLNLEPPKEDDDAWMEMM